MRTFYHLLANALVVATKNNFVWFALTFWVYLETQSVISTGLVGGIFLVATAISGFWFGSLVDNHKKKHVLLASNLASFALFTFGIVVFILSPQNALSSVNSPWLWLFVLILLLGTVVGSIYAIAIPTLITVLVPTDSHDKANGMFGTTMGVAFALTSVGSGLILGFGGMQWVLVIAIITTILSTAHLLSIQIPEREILHIEGSLEAHEQQHEAKGLDIKGTIKLIRSIPGMFALIFFTTFNNLLGGVFMALMDAYGLTLVSVQVWGTLWGVLSLGFILGGLYISQKGLGDQPLRNLFRINIIIWIVCIIFTIQPSIVLLVIGIFIWICLVPFIEATEQTIIQKVVPPERQGRVFGFAHSVEQSASPLTAFLIGPITQLFFIPFMTTGKGVQLIGEWFGTGTGRGIALVFILAGITGLAVTLLAMRSKAYLLLAERYSK